MGLIINNMACRSVAQRPEVDVSLRASFRESIGLYKQLWAWSPGVRMQQGLFLFSTAISATVVSAANHTMNQFGSQTTLLDRLPVLDAMTLVDRGVLSIVVAGLVFVVDHQASVFEDLAKHEPAMEHRVLKLQVAATLAAYAMGMVSLMVCAGIAWAQESNGFWPWLFLGAYVINHLLVPVALMQAGQLSQEHVMEFFRAYPELKSRPFYRVQFVLPSLVGSAAMVGVWILNSLTEMSR